MFGKSASASWEEADAEPPATGCSWVFAPSHRRPQITAKKVTGNNLVLYNVVDTSEEGLVCADGAVRADCFPAAEGAAKIELHSNIETDGGKAWKEKLPANDGKSFEDVYNANVDADVIAAERTASGEHSRVGEMHGCATPKHSK